MKLSILFLSAVAALPLACAAAPAAKPAADNRAEVVFVAPEKFTDVRDSYTGSDIGRDGLLDQIRDYFMDQARRRLPDGYRLYVSITDIDLAGDYEPWRGPNWDDVRIVKDIYPPRINLSYRLVDPAGQVVKEGKSELRDMAFLMRITATFRDDPLRHEKMIIGDWFSETLRGIAKR